jgi:hypothetical protein
MLTNFFKKVVLTGALVMAATPAFGGNGFHQEDLQHETNQFVRAVGNEYSKNHLSFVVHVGQEKMASAVYQVASYLDDQGENVAYFMAPDNDDIPNTTQVEIIKNGISYGVVGFAHQDIKKFQKAVFEEASKAQNQSALSSVDSAPKDHGSMVAGITYNN